VDLPQDYVGRGAVQGQKVGIKLQEIGPRIKLSLQKVQEGLCDGAVLYHSIVRKKPEEAAADAARLSTRKQERARRRELQEENVARKRAKVEEKKRRRQLRRSTAEDEDTCTASEHEVTDIEYFRQEVGEEPDAAMFPSEARSRSASRSPKKRRRLASEDS